VSSFGEQPWAVSVSAIIVAQALDGRELRWAEDRVTAARGAARVITQAPAVTWPREIDAVADRTGLDAALLRTAVVDAVDTDLDPLHRHSDAAKARCRRPVSEQLATAVGQPRPAAWQPGRRVADPALRRSDDRCPMTAVRGVLSAAMSATVGGACWPRSRSSRRSRAVSRIGQRRVVGVGGPLGDRDERTGPGQHRAREGRRRWRALDLGLFRAFVEADAPRVSCPEHGVVVAHVPWARHDPRHTLPFDDTVAWLATRTSKSTLEQLLRIAWRTVGAIVSRVVAEGAAQRDPLAGLARIGIDWVAKVNHRLYRAYLLKEQLRQVFALKGEDGKRLLDHWLAWARRCRIPAFVHLAQRIAKHRISINASLEHRLSNGLVESTNTKVRLLTRMAFGFKSPEAMIALAMLNLGGYCPPLPGRRAAA
jgi:Transposase